MTRTALNSKRVFVISDIHQHLSSSTEPSLLWQLIQEAGLKSPAKNYWDFERSLSLTRNIDNLDSYLKVLEQVDEIQSSPSNVEKSVYNVYMSSYLSGCEYLEMRWNPAKRSKGGSIDLDRLVVAARAGLERANMNFGIKGGMIFCLGRDVSDEANEAVFLKALKYKNKGCLGIDLAGSENLPIPNIKNYYKSIKANGQIRTIHCGETFHDKVEDELSFVIEQLQPDRIGHGIQLVKFPKLMEKASSQGILFEICISSNLATKAVSSLAEFKTIFQKFEDSNIKYCINTDATHLLNTNIARENSLYQHIKNSSLDALEREYRQEAS